MYSTFVPLVSRHGAPGTNISPHFAHFTRSPSTRFQSSGPRLAPQSGHNIVSDALIFSRLILLRGILPKILTEQAAILFYLILAKIKRKVVACLQKLTLD